MTRNFADFDDEDAWPEGGFQSMRPAAPRPRRQEPVAALVEPEDDAAQGFNPSFHASRHERAWILTYLTGFYDDKLIRDVLRPVKGGKEATVYCCAGGTALAAPLVAAKVYRPRMFRNLRNDSLYRLGREVLDAEGKAAWGRRERVALAKKTRFGQDLRHGAWLGSEFSTLQRLRAAGAAVPEPYAQSENAILMEYVGALGQPAPTLHGTPLPRAEAAGLFAVVMENIRLMLAADRVHGDLSAHNILYWEGRVTIIDFPQAVDPYVNPESRMLFARDVLRVCQYFARYGVQADATALATEIWEAVVPG
jgi:RIO kinase 1